MKTLMEICDQAMDGIMPSQEECYYGMLAYRALLTLDHNNLLQVLTDKKEQNPMIKKLKAENSHKSYQTALSKSPKDWLGEDHDPMSDICQKRRSVSKKIFEKFYSDAE